MTVKVTLFSDFICPYCYAGERSARPALEALNLALDWRGYELHPEIPPAGIPAERLRASGIGGRWRQAERFVKESGAPINQPALLPSSRLALEGAEHARNAGLLEPYRDRIFRAYFVEGMDIGDPDVLSGLAAEAGLDKPAFCQEILSRRFRETVDAHRSEAEDLLVSGVPSFFLHGVPIVGAQSTEDYRRAFARIIRKQAEKRAARKRRSPA